MTHVQAHAPARVPAPVSVAGDVRPFLAPRSAVIIGASPRHPAVIEGMLGHDMPLWGVTPGHSEILGLPCVPTAADLPEAPEVAVVLLGHERTEAAVRDALELGVRNFLVPGLGAEAGAHGRAVVARIAELIGAAGGRWVGPNCMGIAVPGGPSPWLTRPSDSFTAGHVAAVVQSGSVGEALTCLGPRVGFRAIVSTGGEVDLGIADFVEFLAEDPATKAIALFIEAVRRPAEFARALDHCASAGKPIVCLKVGVSEAAARAALAHTGAIVGSRSAFSALLARSGALEVHDVAELVETLEVLGRRSWPRGPRVAGVSESGGEAALLSDLAEQAGLTVVPLPAAVKQAIQGEFPALVNPGNPLDAWAAAEPVQIYPRVIELLAGCDEVDVLLALVDLSRFRSDSDQLWNRVVLESLGASARRHGLFAAAVTVHTSDPPEWAASLAVELDIALLRGTRNATAALARVARWRPRTLGVTEGMADAVAEAVAAAPLCELSMVEGALAEHESCEVLSRYGVRFAARRRAHTPDGAAAAVRELGGPVVVKTDGPAHKAREGGVRLGITSPEQAAAVARKFGGSVLVARQVPAGEELFCGASRDPTYGPVIALGRGGIDIEQRGDTTTVLGPLSQADAALVIADAGLPDPHGGLARAAAGVSRLLQEHPAVLEVDINPLIVTPEETIAVDGLIIVGTHDSDAQEVPLP